MFGGKAKLSRFIHPNQRLPGNRAAADAFIEPRRAQRSSSHMSVHSLELSSQKSIKDYYKNEMQQTSPLAAVIHTVYQYNVAAQQTLAQVSYDHTSKQWLFAESNTTSPAYMKRATENCSFHCGVEYVRVLDDTEMQKVARRLAKKKFQIL